MWPMQDKQIKIKLFGEVKLYLRQLNDLQAVMSLIVGDLITGGEGEGANNNGRKAIKVMNQNK